MLPTVKKCSAFLLLLNLLTCHNRHTQSGPIAVSYGHNGASCSGKLHNSKATTLVACAIFAAQGQKGTVCHKNDDCFLDHGVEHSNTTDFLFIVVQGSAEVACPRHISALPNVCWTFAANQLTDLCAFSAVLKRMRPYDRYFFFNCGARGPFPMRAFVGNGLRYCNAQPGPRSSFCGGAVCTSIDQAAVCLQHYFVHSTNTAPSQNLTLHPQRPGPGLHWLRPFIQRLTGQTILVGATTSCQMGRHVQSYAFAMTAFAWDRFAKPSWVRMCARNATKSQMVILGEVSLSSKMRRAGYRVSALRGRWSNGSRTACPPVQPSA